MRNYLYEMRVKGITIKTLAKETGLSRARVSGIARGVKALPKSDSPIYEVIRNTNRRLSYQALRRQGVKPKMASQYRRQFTHPMPTKRIRQSVRNVKFKQPTTRYQLRLVADYIDSKTKEIKYAIESFSNAHLEVDYSTMLEEAINEARARLGGTNWELLKIIEEETITYNLVEPNEKDTETEYED